MTGEHLAGYCGPDRKQLITGNTAPDYLKVEMAGDFGYDILRLGESSPECLETYHQAVAMHGRWAMLGVVGMLAPEALNKYAGFNTAEPIWFKSGAQIFNGGIDHLGSSSLVHAQSIIAIISILRDCCDGCH